MMATSKKATDLAKSEDGQALQKLLLDNGALDVESLNKLLEKGGLKLVATGIKEARATRTSKRAEWAEEGRQLTKEERSLIRKLPTVIGSAPILTEDRDLTPEEVDLWMEEIIVETEILDILNARWEHAARPSFLKATAAGNEGDPVLPDGTRKEFKSHKVGFKVVVTKSGRSGEPDYSKLEKVLDEDVWEEITDAEVSVTRTVNEEKLVEALRDGKVTMEQFAALVPEKQEWPVVSHPKPIKPGEEV